ncbi:hypothetical protein BE21_21895 [Sorangium cellulosum]|uniref:Uncharacterized protein n=1 Tax=Sorangium cellulosum TaxID=56 RepID=A0A150TVL7_SORCE|nr:hypothetical protein BE21_21895 [Sorangium cellulosum]
MSLVPVCMAIACGPVETSQPVIPDDGDDPTDPEPTSACEPRQAGLSADFELAIEGWSGDTNGYFLYNVAAPCQVEAATPTSRDLLCTDGDGEHSLTLTIADSRIAGAIPSSGPVFLRAARTDPEFGENQWFVVRAGSEVTGALLAGGIRAGYETPESGDGYFSPIWMVTGTEEGCPVEVEDECLTRRRARMGFWVDDVQGASILDGHEGDIDASGTYRAVVGESVDDTMGSLPFCGGDDPRYADNLRVLIGAKAPEVPPGTAR